VRAGTIARALALWGESGVRVKKKADVAGYSVVMHWHQPRHVGIKRGLPRLTL
jgi:hypothetical protein